MASKKATEKIIELEPINPQLATVTIEGRTDLVLNKMNAPTAKELANIRKDKAKDMQKSNEWECIITSMHWRDGTPTDFSEEGLREALKNNAPCISAFGLRKSFGDAVVRNKIATYSTGLFASLNILASNNLIPITFSEHYIDEKLMQPVKGKPVLCKLNRFTGWSATFTIEYLENVYSLEQILSIINYAGFGMGIGSGRSSGYGRYQIATIK